MLLTDLNNSYQLLTITKIDTPVQSIEVPTLQTHDLIFRLRGDAEITTENRTFTLQNYDILSVPGRKHYHITSGPEELIVVNFMHSSDSNLNIAYFRPNNPAIFEKLFKDLYNIWSQKYPGYQQKSLGILYTIFGNLEQDSITRSTSHSYSNIRPAIEYFQAHLGDHTLSISTLCKQANLSDTQFRKDFYSVYGTTPIKYIQAIRIDHAASLLLQSTLSVAEIADRCGFSDQRYFSNVFKKYKSVSPTTYRSSQ